MGQEIATVQVDLSDVTKHVINVFWDMKPGEEPLRPEAAAIVKQRARSGSVTSRCLPPGVPAGQFIYPFKILQIPDQIAILSGSGDPARQIYTDGRSLPPDPQPTWMGYSVGTWEGDALVVETIGMTDRSWLDILGHPRSESMRIREVYHRHDFGHMDLEITFDDPIFYTRPFSIKTQLNLLPDTDVLEFVCMENEKDRIHIEKASADASDPSNTTP